MRQHKGDSGKSKLLSLPYRFAEPRSIALYDYTSIVFTAMFGFAFFGQVPDIASIAGFLVILFAAFRIARRTS